MARILNAYGVGAPNIPVLPPPLFFETIPSGSNYDIGQIGFTGTTANYTFYIYSGAGVWSAFGASSGDIIGINGTANQITVTTTSGVATLSIPTTFIAPGSIVSTTTLTGGTGVTATTGNVTSTAGNLVATAGNLNLNGAASKININAATSSSASIGTSAALDGASPSQQVVSTTAVTASSIILLSYATAGGTQGSLSIGTVVPNTSFQILSSANGDTSTVNYLIIN